MVGATMDDMSAAPDMRPAAKHDAAVDLYWIPLGAGARCAWVLVRGGADITTIHPPVNGRAPGWNAGVAVAARRAGHEDA